jgi:hypothetical protein
MHLLEREFNESIWMLIPFLILLIIYAFQNQKTPKFYYSIIKGVVDFHYFRIAYKTEENKNNIDLITIAALSLIGLFIYSLVGINFYSNQNRIIDCFMVISIVIFYYLIKASFIKLSGYLFDAKQTFYVYLIYYKFFIKAVSVISIPFLAFNIILFSKEMDSELIIYNNITFLLLVFILYALRLFHIASKGVENKISYLNIFLYLCTLEISPLVLIYYFLSDY